MGGVDLNEAIKKARILVVDDNPANLTLATRLLEQGGYTDVQGETDPRKVYDMVVERPVDLLLLDIRMPHMDGYQLCEQLRPLFDGDYLPVLMMTAQTDQQTRRRALEIGIRDFLNKPFISWEFLHRVRNVLEVRLLYKKIRSNQDALTEEVRARTRELHETRIEIIRRLVTAGELRDNDTGLHVVRMSWYSRHLAQAYGLPMDVCEQILEAAPMHDVGKIGIPDAILLKPGRLTPQEWDVMKTHTTIGAKILSGSGFDLLRLAEEIALTHHERWDGAGYPHGLAGDQIPLAGRIVAIADVFDAVTSARPYKTAWSVEEARQMILDGAGAHFDPVLAHLFIEQLPHIVELKERFKD